MIAQDKLIDAEALLCSAVLVQLILARMSNKVKYPFLTATTFPTIERSSLSAERLDVRSKAADALRGSGVYLTMRNPYGLNPGSVMQRLAFCGISSNTDLTC